MSSKSSHSDVHSYACCGSIITSLCKISKQASKQILGCIEIKNYVDDVKANLQNMNVEHELVICVYAASLCLFGHHDFCQLQQLFCWQSRGSAFNSCLCLESSSKNSPPDIKIVVGSSQLV